MTGVQTCALPICFPVTISSNDETEFEALNLESLNSMLKEAIELEDYERASHIRDEIQRRKNEEK